MKIRHESVHLEMAEDFTPLFRRTRQRILGYFQSRRVLIEDAEDLCQEVFFLAWINVQRMKRGKETSFVFGIAKRVLLAHVRKKTNFRFCSWRIPRYAGIKRRRIPTLKMRTGTTVPTYRLEFAKRSKSCPGGKDVSSSCSSSMG